MVDTSNFAGASALVGFTPSPTLVSQLPNRSAVPTRTATPTPARRPRRHLTSGGSDETVDFGYYKPITIGDFVWNDSNANGIQDSGEPGINGVTLTLTGTSGTGAAVTDHATTTGNGAYLFTEAPGTYTVTVDASNFTGSGALAATPDADAAGEQLPPSIATRTRAGRRRRRCPAAPATDRRLRLLPAGHRSATSSGTTPTATGSRTRRAGDRRRDRHPHRHQRLRARR